MTTSDPSHTAAGVVPMTRGAPAPSQRGVVQVCTVVLADERGEVLTVRKAGTRWFMLPGGKPEPGEPAAQTVVRECAEELGAALRVELLVLLGTFRAPAANEHGHEVSATVFTHPEVPVGHVRGEIAELRRLDIHAVPLPDDLAPMLAEHVVPRLREPARTGDLGPEGP